MSNPKINVDSLFGMFKTGSDVADYAKNNPSFVECLYMALKPERKLVEAFLDLVQVKAEDFKVNIDAEKLEDINDRVVLNFFGFVCSNVYLKLDEKEKVNLLDCAKIKYFCMRMFDEDPNDHYDFVLKIQIVGELGTNTFLARKGLKLKKLFNALNKMLGKKHEYQVVEIRLLNEPIGEDEHKLVSGDEIKDPQKFMDEYQQP